MKNSSGSESEGKSYPKGEHPFDYLQEGFTNLTCPQEWYHILC